MRWEGHCEKDSSLPFRLFVKSWGKIFLDAGVEASASFKLRTRKFDSEN